MFPLLLLLQQLILQLLALLVRVVLLVLEYGLALYLLCIPLELQSLSIW